MKARAAYYRAAELLSRVTPQSALRRSARFAAGLYARCGPRDLNAIQQNMRHALGAGVSEDKIKRSARELTANYSGYLVDLLYARSLTPEFMRERVRVTGRERLDEALARGKGAIVVSAHLGNWEIGAMVLSRMGYPISALALRHSNPAINAVFEKRRTAHGLSVIHVVEGRSLRGCYRELAANNVLAMNADRLFSQQGYRVRFLGRDTAFPKGMEKLARATGATVLPAFCVESESRFELEIQEPLVLEGDGVMTQAFAGRVEEAVRRHPTQWYLFQAFWEKPEWPI